MSSSAPQARSRAPRLSALPGAALEKAQLSIAPRRRTRPARVPFVTLVSLLLLAGVVGLLLFNTSMQQASFAATEYAEQAATLTSREQTLRMELAILDDPQNVARRARDMGMVPAGSPAFLDLASGEVTGNSVPANAGNRLRIEARLPTLPSVLDPDPEIVEVRRPPEGVLPQDSERDTEASSGKQRENRDRNEPRQ